MNYLANALTVLSLICGFISIIFSLEEHFTFAAWAILLSVIFDGLDGQVARKNSTPSEFGKELDSLVDVVAFGIAPSVLGYVFIYRAFYFWATLALLIFLTSSVMRLAKYNITPKEKMVNYFYGVPTTISGGMLAAFVLIYRRKMDLLSGHFVPFAFLIIVLALAFLMVSRIKYLNLDGLKQVLGKSTRLIILTVIGLLGVAALFKKSGIIIFLLFLIYLLFSPLVVKRLNHHH